MFCDTVRWLTRIQPKSCSLQPTTSHLFAPQIRLSQRKEAPLAEPKVERSRSFGLGELQKEGSKGGVHGLPVDAWAPLPLAAPMNHEAEKPAVSFAPLRHLCSALRVPVQTWSSLGVRTTAQNSDVGLALNREALKKRGGVPLVSL